MLRGEKQLSKYLTNWCQENGFDVKCRLSKEFKVDVDKKILCYSVFVLDDHKELFYDKVCKDLLTSDKEYNIFLLSFFHELGHTKTFNSFSVEDKNNRKKLVRELRAKDDSNLEDYLNYYYNDIEYAATKWGCEYINKNSKKVVNFFKGFEEVLKNFYTVNGLEVD